MLTRRAALGAFAALSLPWTPVLAQTRTTLRIGATANDTYAEAYYGVDKGFFAKAGLDVEISTFSNGNLVAAAVASGSLDIGVTNPVAIANAVSNGIPFVYFAGGAFYDTALPTTMLCVAKDGPIQDPKQLVGKAVGNQTAKDLGTLVIAAYLKEHGVDPNSISIAELPMAAMGAALQRGTIAAALLSEPSMTVAIQAGLARPLAKVFDTIAPRFYISGWFTTRDWLRKNGDLAKRYAAVIYDTARWANRSESLDESGQILAKYAKLDPALVKLMRRCKFDTGLNPKFMAPPVALAVKSKLTSKPVTVAEMLPS